MKTIITALALVAFATPALSVDRIASKSTSKAAAVSVANAQAASGAISTSQGGSATLIFNAAPEPALGISGISGGFGNSAPQQITYDFSDQVPDVYAPALAGGGACTESASAGTSHPGFGLSFGLSWEGENCAIRNEIMVLHNTQQAEEAKVHGCLHLERVKATFELMGKDCLGNPLEGEE